MEVHKEMQSLLVRRAAILGLAFALSGALAAAPASAQRGRPGGRGGAPNAPRIPAGAVDLTGTITALDMTAGSVQVTTDHGTAVTLTVNSNTQLVLNGRSTTVANLAVGDRAEAIYKPSDKIALALGAATPQTGVLSGAITALDLTAGTLTITPLVGMAQTVKVTAQTLYRLNGQRVAPETLQMGLLASVQTASDGTVRAVAAQTPPLIDLLGTITGVNVTGTGTSAAGTLQVTTPGATSITLQIGPYTAVQVSKAASTADKLAMGDQVTVEYEYRLVPNSSRALIIAATPPAATTTPGTTTPTPTPGTTTPTPTPGTTTPTPAAGAALASITLNPASVKGGTAATGTVTLSAAAAAGGAVVALASSNPMVAGVPATVTVPAGMTSATFSVMTSAVTAPTPVVIFAAYGGASNIASLMITP
jgi:Domain of unknown function (DUF5666)